MKKFRVLKKTFGVLNGQIWGFELKKIGVFTKKIWGFAKKNLGFSRKKFGDLIITLYYDFGLQTAGKFFYEQLLYPIEKV